MSAVLLIARRELQGYLRTMTGWIIAAAVLLIDGLLFNAFAMDGARRSAEVLSRFFYFASGPTMVAAIFLSMRLLAEERQLGTLDLLYSSPVRDRDIVLGKFLSALAFLTGLTVLTLYMPLLVGVHGRVSLGHLVAGYLGLTLLGAASLALGTLGSSLARNQVVAAIVGAALLVSLLLAWLLASATEPPFSRLLSALALHNGHFPPFQSGQIHLRDVVYYLAVTWAALFATTRVLEARRWR
jgi:ABC-2 type transport system permease protein